LLNALRLRALPSGGPSMYPELDGGGRLTDLHVRATSAIRA
jgi:hypothetical protein